MPNNKIAIFLDIDGTVYSHARHKVPLSTLKILYQLSLSGNYDIYIASGRGPAKLDDINEIKDSLKGYNLMNGGLLIIDNQVVFQDLMNKDDILPLIKSLEEMKISYAACTKEKEYYQFYDNDVTEDFRKYYLSKGISMSDYSWVNDTIKLWAIDSNERILELAKKHPNLNFDLWGERGCDISPLWRNKGEGVRMIVKIMDYDMNNVYAFGDADNDLGMFKVVTNSICMGNGNEKAKQLAKYVTDTIDNDGIEKAIKKIIMKEDK